MYAYAGNNPVKYTDPDGRAVIVYLKYGLLDSDGTDKYVVRSQNFFEVAVFDKIQSASYPAFGDSLTNLQYSIVGERKINESPKEGFDYKSGTLSAFSIAGGIKISKTLEKIGTIANVLSWIELGKDLLNLYANLKSFAMEDLTCNLFSEELSSDSSYITEKLYLYAKQKLVNLESISKLSVNYDYLGSVKNYRFSDPTDIDVIRNDINNYKRELIYGSDK
ncbi:MAG: hypothetical protein VZQ99_04935 [Treponema sp.]|nr:hypothetical protein [Treponema sp.]